MELTEGMREVHFSQYCKICQYEKTKESEEPCSECLNEPARQYSHKPVKYEEAVKKVKREENNNDNSI